MQKEIPILFSTPMVQAIIDGRKTETRRVMKPQPLLLVYKNTLCVDSWNNYASDIEDDYKTYKCPYGKPGDVLWVRESFNRDYPTKQIYFKASWETLPEWLKEVANEHGFGALEWKPSIHMPKAAARIWLQVEEIRVERLQDITEESAIAEGIIDYEDGTYKNYFTQKGLREQDGVDCILAKGSFQSLWCSINGLESWDANPWVWVVKFKVLSTTGKPRTLGYQPDTGEYHFANKIIKP